MVSVRLTIARCSYELLFGKRPFRGRTNTALTNSILHEQLTWPEDAPGRCSSEGMHAIRAVRTVPPFHSLPLPPIWFHRAFGRPGVRADQLATFQFLDRDPNRRLGYRPGGGGFEDIKAHPWFRGIDWDAMYKKEVVPPFEPDVSGDPSTSAPDLS